MWDKFNLRKVLTTHLIFKVYVTIIIIIILFLFEV